MSIHFLSHPWDVQNVEEGVLVTCTPRDLNAMTQPVLMDELHDLVLESGAKNLHLDLSQIHHLSNTVLDHLRLLNEQLRTNGGHVMLCNLNADLYEACQRHNIAEALEVRMQDFQASEKISLEDIARVNQVL